LDVIPVAMRGFAVPVVTSATNNPSKIANSAGYSTVGADVAFWVPGSSEMNGSALRTLSDPPDFGFAAASATPDPAVTPSTAPTVNTNTTRHASLRIRFILTIPPLPRASIAADSEAT
jgi:hypothetical protein